MPDWSLWRDMGQESLLSARTLREDNKLRNAVSRFYYAAYQTATAFILYRGQNPPLNREAWSHAETPELLFEQLKAIQGSRGEGKDLMNKLKLLYKTRCEADYVSNVIVSQAVVDRAKKDAGYIIKVIGSFLPRS